MKLPFLGFGSEQALRAMADALPDGVFTTDLDGLVTYWNAAAHRITGWSPEDALGRDCSILAGDAVHGCSCGAGPLRCGLASSGRASKCCTARAKDGRMLLIVKNAVPLYASSGEVIGALESFTDVTSYAASQVHPLPAPPAATDFHGLVGRDAAMTELYELVKLVAGSDATVLVLGESGTGKERVAEAIHALSPRSAGPFVRVPCSALDDELLEDGPSVRPGEPGGARPARPWRLDDAQGGTLVVDEIADASPAAQLALLRAIEGRRLERGGARVGAAGIRLVCTTHHDLKALVRRGSFRADLYFRIAAFPVRVPPLREHPGDLPLLAEHVLSSAHAARGPISPEVLAALEAYGWPGNVRELRNVLELAALRAGNRPIQLQDLPREVRPAVAPPATGREAPGIGGGRTGPELGREAIASALAETGWNRSEAARRLGISRVTLWKRIKQLGIAPPR